MTEIPQRFLIHHIAICIYINSCQIELIYWKAEGEQQQQKNIPFNECVNFIFQKIEALSPKGYKHTQNHCLLW